MGLFGNINTKHVKKLEKIAALVEAKEDEYKSKTDEELKATTLVLKQQLADGKTTDDILPDAFALVREAAARVLNMRHFHVQILGGIALYQGRIAEMHTGEGKTLVSTLPAYLMALRGKGVHVVTVNDYLAKRDAEWMGKVHRFLGLTVGVSLMGQSPEEKRAAYNCDITYCTNNELGFDYLRDNLAIRKRDRVLRGLDFAIVDEVDSILIDEARTPLIISGQGDKSSDQYVVADKFVKSLKPSDYELDEEEKRIRLTDAGVEKVERYFNLENYGDIENLELTHYVNNALHANVMMKRDDNYIVKNGEIIIVDEFTGRLMPGRRYSNGLHQAIEAKEGVDIKNENQTLATITFQNLFRMYNRLSGMTGTAKTEEMEFNRIYALDVVTIPTNLKKIRIDYADIAYTTENGKFNAIVEDVKACQAKGQPVLIGTITIEKSELLSKYLNSAKIPHVVLNAKNHELESEIVAQAGRKGAVTIATNMAGRGTDILLGGNAEFMAKKEMKNKGYEPEVIDAVTAYKTEYTEEELKAKAEYEKIYAKFKEQTAKEKEEVKALGGLKIIGTERHESRRIDNQLRGRAGRQGDPGESVFYLSFEDDLIRRFAGTRLQTVANMFKIGPDQPFQFKIFSKQIENAQKKIEGINFSYRRQTVEFDEVLNKQRQVIYEQRNQVVDGENVHDQIINMFDEFIGDIVYSVVSDNKLYSQWNLALLNEKLEEENVFPKGFNFVTEDKVEDMEAADVYNLVLNEVIKQYNQKAKFFKDNGIDFDQIERDVMLRQVDKNWIENINSMSILRNEIGLRHYGNKNPVDEYKKEGYVMFENMIKEIQTSIAKILIGVREINVQRPVQTAPVDNLKKVTSNNITGSARAVKTVGRNDPCPCGSGKKYKNCCGKNAD